LSIRPGIAPCWVAGSKPVETRDVETNEISELKLIIIHEQERIAELERNGGRAQARTARDRLYTMLNRLDVLQLLQRSE
jgi:hypothetical protein